MGRFDPADVDIRRVGIAPERLLELELCLVFLLMVHRVLLQDLGGLKLRLDQVLLQTLSQAIPGFCDLLDLSQLLLILIENRQRLGVIEKLEVDLLDLFLDRTLRSFIATPGVVGVFFRLGFLQAKLAGTRDVLGDTEAGVIKVAALITGERLRTADSEMLERHLRIGDRRRLDRDLHLSLPVAPRREHDRTAGKGLVNQRSQPIRTSGGLSGTASLSEVLMSRHRGTVLCVS